MDLHASRRLLVTTQTENRKRSPRVRRKPATANPAPDFKPNFTTGSLPRNFDSENRQDLLPKVKSSSFNGSDTKTADDWQTLVSAFATLFSQGRATDQTTPIWKLTETVRDLRRSNRGEFLFEFYEHKILPNEMGLIRASLERAARKGSLMEKLVKSWDEFFRNTLPKLQLVLSPIEKDLSVRESSLRAYRDHVVLELQECGYLKQDLNYNVAPAIKQMMLVLQTIHDGNLSSSHSRLANLVPLVVPFSNLVPSREKKCSVPAKTTNVPKSQTSVPTFLPRSRSDAILSSRNETETKPQLDEPKKTLEKPLKSALATPSSPTTTKKKTHFRSRSDFTLYAKPEEEVIGTKDDATMPRKPLPLQPAFKKSHTRSRSGDLATTTLLRLIRKQARSEDDS